jgi:hypothetical protein
MSAHTDVHGTASSSPLRGREPEQRLLAERLALAALKRGRGGLILVRGSCISESATVLHGETSPAESTMPLAPLLAALLSADEPPGRGRRVARAERLP